MLGFGKKSEEKPSISILIPVYNEEENVPILIEKVLLAISKNDLNGEVILINDGSTDRTQEALDRVSKGSDAVKVLAHCQNRGLTEALKTGFKGLSGEIVILLPADLESDPEEDIPKLLNEMEKGFDVVAGWRQGRKDGRVVSSWVFNSFSRFIFGSPVHDLNWIKAMRREVIEDLRFQLRSDWHRLLLPLIASKGYTIGEVKTNWYPRKSGKSKFGFSRGVISFFDILVLKFLLTLTNRSMVFFGSIGTTLIAAGVGIILYRTYLYLFLDVQDFPYLSSASFFILFGLMSFMMGFLSELIVENQQRIEDIQERLKTTP